MILSTPIRPGIRGLCCPRTTVSGVLRTLAYPLVMCMCFVLGEIMATREGLMCAPMRLVSSGNVNRRLIGLLKKFRTREARRLIVTS